MSSPAKLTDTQRAILFEAPADERGSQSIPSTSRQTGLRDRVRLGNREKHTAMAVNAFFGVQNGGGCAFPSA